MFFFLQFSSEKFEDVLSTKQMDFEAPVAKVAIVRDSF